jgi:hypothetical protein
MTTTHTVRRIALTAAVAGVAALTAAPAFAKPGPIDYGSLQDAGAVDHPTKAQVEHQESALSTTTTSSGLPQQIKARVEQLERATADQPPAARSTRGSESDTSGSSVPGTAAALIGVVLAAGAGGVVVYRFRHHGDGGSDGRVGAATA